MRLCDLPTCGKRHKARGYCADHYLRFLRYGDPHFRGRVTYDKGATCWLRCGGRLYANGVCQGHYSRMKNVGTYLNVWGEYELERLRV